MKHIIVYVITIITMFLIINCSSDKSNVRSANNTDSIVYENNNDTNYAYIKSNDSLLLDGWYVTDKENGMKKQFYTTTAYLALKPKIPFDDIDSISSELFIDGIDTSLIINFNLSMHGEKQWQEIIKNSNNRYIYFVMDNKIINLWTVFTDFENKKSSFLQLELGYSDFSKEEGIAIESKIRNKLIK